MSAAVLSALPHSLHDSIYPGLSFLCPGLSRNPKEMCPHWTEFIFQPCPALKRFSDQVALVVRALDVEAPGRSLIPQTHQVEGKDLILRFVLQLPWKQAPTDTPTDQVLNRSFPMSYFEIVFCCVAKASLEPSILLLPLNN